MKKFIIVEIIPNMLDYKKGCIVQLQALKIKEGRIIDRMDYRLDYNLIDNPDIIRMINYDNEMFNYTKSKKMIINKFMEFIEDYDIFIIDNVYTRNYLKDVKNNMISIFDYLNICNDDQAFNVLINKYQLQPSNHLVDLLFEAITFHDA